MVLHDMEEEHVSLQPPEWWLVGGNLLVTKLECQSVSQLFAILLYALQITWEAGGLSQLTLGAW